MRGIILQKSTIIKTNINYNNHIHANDLLQTFGLKMMVRRGTLGRFK